MIRVKVLVPNMDEPYFDGKVNEKDYDDFNEFLEELKDSFGEIDCEASVVKPETTEDDESDEESDPIAEHIKDHPIIDKNNKMDENLQNFFHNLDSINTETDSKDFLDKLDNIDSEEIPPADNEEDETEDTPEEMYCSVKVKIRKRIISDIYYRENPEIKKNAVDGSYPILDDVDETIEVPIPVTVIEKCTPYNIAQFIKQNTIFILMDPEYCDVDDENLDKVFCTDDFDDSYCYDTGVIGIFFTDIQFPCKDCMANSTTETIYRTLCNGEIDYREMERIYTKLRLFNKD